MYAIQIVQGADAGFVLSQDPRARAALSSLVNHGFTRGFHFVHYFRGAVNAKINGLGAAMACGSLDHIRDTMAHRSVLSAAYRPGLLPLQQQHLLRLMPVCGVEDTPWQFGIECITKAQRSALRQHLADHAIETRDYFFALHLQPAFFLDHAKRSNKASIGNPGCDIARLPVAESLGSRGFYLPTWYGMTEQDVGDICAIIKQFFNTAKAAVETEVRTASLVLESIMNVSLEWEEI
jgi:perosamine synthetase